MGLLVQADMATPVINDLGSREVKVTPGSGSHMTVRGFAFFGSVEVKPLTT